MPDALLDDDENGGSDHDAHPIKKRDREVAKAQMQVAYGERLNLELDAVGFVKGRRRSGALAEQFDLDRSQGYRFLKGVSAPDALYQTKLRKLGVSMDRILDAISNDVPVTYDVFIGGELVAATVQKGTGFNCATALLPKEGGYELIPMPRDGDTPEGVIPILSIQFIVKPTLAIVEDDSAMLDQLERQLWDTFRTVKFESANALIKALKAPNTFNAVLMDWRLPDMDGEDLVAQIRAHSKVPICILTMDMTASKAIARAFANGNVDHVQKPADPEILAARIQMAIKNTSM